MTYRDRIYGQYVHARHQPLAPSATSGFRPRSAQLRSLIRNHFPPDKAARIIELGSGHGALLYFAKEAGYTNLFGVDRSPEQVASARALGIDVREGDLIETLRGVKSESVDAVVAFDVLEHFTKPEAVVFVDEVVRVLRRGGRFIVHVPNGDSPFGGASFFNDFTHEICFNRNSIAQLFLSSGFVKVDCYEDTPVVHGLKSAVRWVLWKMIRGALRLWTAAETGGLGRDAVFTRNFLAVALKHQ